MTWLLVPSGFSWALVSLETRVLSMVPVRRSVRVSVFDTVERARPRLKTEQGREHREEAKVC